MIFLKSFVAKILTNPIIGFLISIFYSDLLPFKSLKIYTDSNLIMNKTKAQIFWHIYEGAEIKFIHKYFPSGFDTIELGSSIGVVSSFIRSKMSKENKLICVEAFPDLCDLTTKNLQLNENQFMGILESRKGSDKLNPYIVLGCDPEDNLQDIRKKYLLLSKEHHPDVLVAKGVPEEVLEESKKKMRSINSAWDQIQKLKNT